VGTGTADSAILFTYSTGTSDRTMNSIFSVIPDPEKTLELEPEELAGYVMAYFNGHPDNEH
jgi:hypothetical protein